MKQDTGYQIELESGQTLTYTELDGTGASSIDLLDSWLDGATGDSRDNQLSAQDHTRAVQISGGAGNDVIHGGQLDDILSGDAGADSLLRIIDFKVK